MSRVWYFDEHQVNLSHACMGGHEGDVTLFKYLGDEDIEACIEDIEGVYYMASSSILTNIWYISWSL